MNRAGRRKMMRTIPGYKKTVQEATQKAVDDLEKMFQKKWEENENNGGDSYDENNADNLSR